MKKGISLTVLSGVFLLSGIAARAEFLYAPSQEDWFYRFNGFYSPTIASGARWQYASWDVFYSPHTAPNYPDRYAEWGGKMVGSVISPVTRTEANAAAQYEKFPSDPAYNPSNPYAFWHERNPTITQTSTSAQIIGPGTAGNIYTYSEKTHYVLKDDPLLDDNSEGLPLSTVILQFQMDGGLPDFSSLQLVYKDQYGSEYFISALDAEYLREFRSTSGEHWSSQGGYASRYAIQWDLSDIAVFADLETYEYEIRWSSQTSSVSLQKLDLLATSEYVAALPISARWEQGNGLWSDNGNWTLHKNGSGEANEHLQGPQANGNIRFQNTGAATITLDENAVAGEVIFESSHDVTLNSVNGSFLTLNTGLTTRSGASGLYTLNTDVLLDAVTFFEINDGSLRINGSISGNYGVVKSGAGELELNGDNTFTGFLGIREGTVHVRGQNTYTGQTSIVNGALIVHGDAGATGALGNSTTTLQVGANQSLYANYAEGAPLHSDFIVDGDYQIARNIQLAPGDFGKRLATRNNVANGAVISGNIFFTGASADPDDPNPDIAAGNVYLTAYANTDRLTLSGAMSGGARAKTLTLDGQGTVAYTQSVKSYQNSTVVASGTLLIAADSGYNGAGDITVADGATLQVDGAVTGTGALYLTGGVLTGSGSIQRDFSVGAGSVIAPGQSPGTLLSGSQSWENGGTYQWELANANGQAGTDWDLLEINGDLELSLLSTNGFTINLISLDGDHAPGLALGFDPLDAYQWKIATIVDPEGEIIGFDPAQFNILYNDFLNPTFGGSFGITASGNDLYIVYTPQAIPEPGTWLLLTLGAGGVWIRYRRHRGKNRA